MRDSRPPIDAKFLQFLAGMTTPEGTSLLDAFDNEDFLAHAAHAAGVDLGEPDPRCPRPMVLAGSFADAVRSMWEEYDLGRRGLYDRKLSPELYMLDPPPAGAGTASPLTVAVAFFGAYQHTRHTYVVTPELQELLTRRELRYDLPVTALETLPLPAFGMTVPPSEGLPAEHAAVCYDVQPDGGVTLHVYRLGADRLLTPWTRIDLVGRAADGSLERYALAEGVKRVLDRATMQGAELPPETLEIAHAEFVQGAKRVVPALLYIAGDDDTVARVGHRRPAVVKRVRRKLAGTVHEPFIRRAPSVADVGLQVRQALVRYADAQEPANDPDWSGKKMRPHVRAPHPHLYWTGPGRSVPVVKYLGPVVVNGGTKKTPSIQPVQ